MKNIHLANAMIAGGDKHKGELMKSLAIGYGAVYYWFLSSEAQKEAQLFYSNPKSNIAIEVWNLPDTGLIKKMMKLTFPSIEYHRKLYINPDFQRITLEELLNEIHLGVINKKNVGFTVKKYEESNNFQTNLSQCKEKLEDFPKNDFEMKMKFEKLCWKAENKSKIPIRILCSFQLIDPLDPLFFASNRNKLKFVKKIVEVPLISWFLDPTNKKSFEPYSLEAIIIHIHGGGFISMSSGSHQIYTRKWANALKIAVFSIDYKLAPKHPYPQAFDDCFQAYLWILGHVETYFSRVY